MGCEKTTNDVIKFSYHFLFIYFFLGLSSKIFCILHKLDEKYIWIPVADLSLDQSSGTS